jgi:hypothetical protein
MGSSSALHPTAFGRSSSRWSRPCRSASSNRLLNQGQRGCGWSGYHIGDEFIQIQSACSTRSRPPRSARSPASRRARAVRQTCIAKQAEPLQVRPVSDVLRHHTVELILATLNTPPQVDSLFQRLSGPFPRAAEASGPSRRSSATAEYSVEDVSGRTPRPLHRRLEPNQRAALVTAFATGVRQRDLAVQYGISVRSVKRLIRYAREAGTRT